MRDLPGRGRIGCEGDRMSEALCEVSRQAIDLAVATHVPGALDAIDTLVALRCYETGVATVMHASLWFHPSEGLVYYSSGMIALVALASALTRVPSFATPHPPANAAAQLARAFCIAGVCALVYFNRFVF